MKVQCEVIRDLLPLYADDVCSPASRELVDGHLPDCPDCRQLLEQLRSSELEDGLQAEKQQVIRRQARRFKRRSAAVGAFFATLFAIPVLVCLIVNLTSGASLGWFYVVAAAMAVAAALVVVPLMVSRDRMFWTFCALCVSLVVLLAVVCLYTRGRWFFTAASASLFGLSVACGPFALKARPLRRWVGNRSRALLALSVDVILFANMMNMISLNGKPLVCTIGVALLCAAGIALLVIGGINEGRKEI